jgi:hypothetical protein
MRCMERFRHMFRNEVLNEVSSEPKKKQKYMLR